MATLHTLRIRKYFDVAPTTLTFHRQRNLLLGVNGGGKTTLLNLIAMVLNLDFLALEQVPFEIGFKLEESTWTMDVDIKNEVSSLPEGLAARDVRSKPLKKSFTAHVRIEFHEHETDLRWRFETDGRKASVTPPRGRPIEDRAWRAHALGSLSFLLAAQISIHRDADIDSVQRFDEGVDFFRWIHAEAESPFQLWHFLGDRSLSGRAPAAMSDKLLNHELQLGERLSFDSDQEEFLSTFVAASGFEAVKLTADLIERSSPDSDGSFQEKFKLTLFCARQDGREFIQNDLSFGQKRLWAFLYYLECNRSSVIADELVNGLHHRWIKLCVERIGERQAFLTSQNPLLFDFIPLGTLTEPRCMFIRCDLDGPKMRWRNLEADESTRLYEAYEAGIESVGEILQTRGLW